MLCAAAHLLVAAPRTSQGVVPPVGLPLDEPELLPASPEEPEPVDPEELPEAPDELPDEPEPATPELPEETEPPELADEPELLPDPPEEPEPFDPPLAEPLPAPVLLLASAAPPLPDDVPMPPELAPELPPGGAENDPQATPTAPNDTATKAGTTERFFFIATSPIASPMRAGGRPVADRRVVPHATARCEAKGRRDWTLLSCTLIREG
ncbi:MAG: hypothetical protein M3O50_12030 [Myxococcota bacterium]|nr:hypothetical protein [Myxococcota bacterium]